MNKTTIVLNEEFKVEIDAYNHTLYRFVPEHTTVYKSKETLIAEQWSVCGYYPNIPQSVRAAIKLTSLDDSVVTLEEYLEKIKVTEREITANLKVAGGEK